MRTDKETKLRIYDYDIPYEDVENRIKESFGYINDTAEDDDAKEDRVAVPEYYKKGIEIFSMKQCPDILTSDNIYGYMFLNRKRHVLPKNGYFVVTDNEGNEKKKYAIYTKQPNESKFQGFIPYDDKFIIILKQKINWFFVATAILLVGMFIFLQ